MSAAIAVDQQLPLIMVQLGKNNITRVLLDGGSGINIMSEELRKKLGLPKPSPALYNLKMADQPIGLFRDLTIIIQEISYVVTFTVMKMDPSAVYSLLLGRPWLKDAKVTHDWGNNIVTIQGHGQQVTIP